MEKTHWKKVVSDPNYIGEGDFEPKEEKILTIARVNSGETVVTAEGKSTKAVIHWQEKEYKPMILNVARSKNIEKVVGSPFFEDWPNHKIQLYIEHGIKAFGEVVSAVRVRPYKPKPKQEIPPCSDCGGKIEPAAGKTAEWMAAYTSKKYNRPLCGMCAAKAKMAQDAEKEPAEESTESAEVETNDIDQ